jgi:CheY-like chemotaxis protein
MPGRHELDVEQESAATGDSVRSRPLILVVEDDLDLQASIHDVLDQSGYRVVTAVNGREALDLLVNGRINPALMLLDLRMPVMDGWEFARVIRNYRRLADIPVLIISTPSSGNAPPPCADGVLPKPFTPSALLDEVRRHAPSENSASPV